MRVSQNRGSAGDPRDMEGLCGADILFAIKNGLAQGYVGTTHDFGAPSYNFEDALRHSDLCNGQDDRR